MTKTQTFNFDKKFILTLVGILVVLLVVGFYPTLLAHYQIAAFNGQYASDYDRAIAMNAKGYYAGSTELLESSYKTKKDMAVGIAWFRNLKVQKKASAATLVGSQVVTDFPNNADFRIEVAQLMADNGKKDEAIALVQDGITKYDTPSLKDFLIRLQNLK
jgi:hypothetical protein